MHHSNVRRVSGTRNIPEQFDFCTFTGYTPVMILVVFPILVPNMVPVLVLILVLVLVVTFLSRLMSADSHTVVFQAFV